MQRHKLPIHGHGYTAYKDVIRDDSGVGGVGWSGVGAELQRQRITGKKITKNYTEYKIRKE